MENVVFRVLDFLEFHNDTFRNESRIEFSFYPDHSLTLVSALPYYRINDERVIINLVRKFETIHDFVYDCNITHEDAMEDISPESLLNWYLKGEGKVFCCTDEYLRHFLYFRKHHNKLYAENELELEHIVSAKLETFDDLILYTRNYALGQNN